TNKIQIESEASRKRKNQEELANIDLKLLSELRNKSSETRDNAKIYKTFYIIKDAYRYSVEKGAIPIFSEDKPEKIGIDGKKKIGTKKFIVASYDIFWKMFCNRKPELRCFYEILLP